MSKHQRKDRRVEARKAVEHAAYIAALRNGQRPPRAATFTDRRKQADKRACRDFRW